MYIVARENNDWFLYVIKNMLKLGLLFFSDF